jgi:phenylalanyl-tRNA synthetase beta chain
MRATMLYSGLEAIAYNANRRNGNLKLYEFGKTYHVAENKYKEDQHFTLYLTGKMSEHFSDNPNYFIPIIDSQNRLTKPIVTNKDKVDLSIYNQVVEFVYDAKKALDAARQEIEEKQLSSFRKLKAAVDGLLERLSIMDFTTEEPTCGKLAYGLQYNRGPKRIVKFGAVKADALKKASVDQAVFHADFNFDLILQLVKKNVVVNQDIPKFPSVRRDLSMLVDKAVTFNQLKQISQKTERKLIKKVNVFDVYEGDKLPSGKKSYALSFIIQDDEKTLTDKAIDTLMQKLIYNLGKETGAEIRK